MRTILITLFLAANWYSFSQSTLIEYNYQTETYKFFKITRKGDTIQMKKPYAIKGIPSKVVVKDLNTFYYDVAFTSEHFENAPVSGDESVEKLAENFTAGFDAFNGLIDETKSGDMYQSLFVDGKFQGMNGLKNVLGMAESEFTVEMKKLESRGKTLEETQNEILKASNDLKAVFDKLLLAEFVNDQLVKLQMNRTIAPAEMQKRAQMLIEKILIDDISLEGVVNYSQKTSDRLATGYSKFKSSFAMYQAQEEDLELEMQQLETKMGGDNFGGSLKNFQTEVKIDFQEILNNLDALETLVGEYDAMKVRNDYLTAFENYDKIMHADFDFEYSVNADLDVTSLTMEFIENKSIDSSGTTNVIKTRQLDIPTMGGLRINSSAGMSFLRYMNGQQSYNSDGGVIREVQGDAFTPSLTTMFHFYKQTPRAVSLGGTFGVGVPTEGDKDFIYMVGGSAIIGKSQRVILNFGGFGGKIERLDGVAVGDAIPSGSVVPTKKVFDFGAFLGLTLNINKMF